MFTIPNILIIIPIVGTYLLRYSTMQARRRDMFFFLNVSFRLLTLLLISTVATLLP